jgi:hypothetical protein
MNPRTPLFPLLLLAAMLAAPLAAAYDSGSTGADGAFAPAASVTLPLPPSGIFNFTSVNIPRNVTVRFQRNTANTPVVILASGDVFIGGTLDVSGTDSPGTGTGGDGAVADDGKPGLGGPGGYDGGWGGEPGKRGGNGQGPGGGISGAGVATSGCGTPKHGFEGVFRVDYPRQECSTVKAYGADALIPLIGGSGGGGGWGGSVFRGSGGGGGGGAILIAASGTIRFDPGYGLVLASGGLAGEVKGTGEGFNGGDGSGGAIRLVATAITGGGRLRAGYGSTYYYAYSATTQGRIRVEAESYDGALYVNLYGNTSYQDSPLSAAATPGPVFIAGLPGLKIIRVAGQPVPDPPSGKADVSLAADTPNPVTVEFETTGVPVGNTVKLTVTPTSGDATTVVSPALTGSTARAGASVSVDIPEGETTLLAQTTYIVLAAVGDQLAPYAGGERVEKVRLAADLQGRSRAYLITVSGREFEVDPRLLAMAAAG